MKNKLENIDKIFKQAFDGFESNVDPSVWNNIQRAITSGTVGSSASQSTSSVGSRIVGKSVLIKIVAGVALLSTVGASVYFISNIFEENDSTVTNESVADDNLAEISQEPLEDHLLINSNNYYNGTEEEITFPVTGKQSEELSEKRGVVANEEKEHATNNGVNNIERLSNLNNKVKSVSETVVKGSNVANLSKNSSTAQPESSEVNNAKRNAIEVEKPAKFLVKINVNETSGKAPLTVQFDSFGEGIVASFWDFRDGSEEVNEVSPMHTFTKEGTYNVKLKGIDKNGKEKYVYKTIVVEKDHSSSLQGPLQNVFSPNGDGKNDFFKIRGKNIERIQVKIVDGKGNIVYLMDSLDDIWEGKDQDGNYLDQGQYYIVGLAIGKDGDKHAIKQVISLLR